MLHFKGPPFFEDSGFIWPILIMLDPSLNTELFCQPNIFKTKALFLIRSQRQISVTLLNGTTGILTRKVYTTRQYSNKIHILPLFPFKMYLATVK